MKEALLRLRIDPVLVDKFQRLPGGINEVGVKIVRDLGLRYEYNKITQTLDILGPDTEILALGVETLRFWIEDDIYPNTGVTCQIGYPNRHTVVWRFHGDYAKKFDHLFVEEIAQLKLIPTLNIKAVPSKRNPAFIELYCHFTFFQKVKTEVEQLSEELSKIYQDDFFVPKSDSKKAREFAKSKAKDHLVLFALKEIQTTDNIRVWIFARQQGDALRARREWLEHVGEIARDIDLVEKSQRELDIRSASYVGGNTKSAYSRVTQSRKPLQKDIPSLSSQSKFFKPPSPSIRGGRFSKPATVKKSIASFNPYDDANYPRPDDFVYPINTNLPTFDEEETVNDVSRDPFAFGANEFDSLDDNLAKKNLGNHPGVGEAKWVSEDDVALYKAKIPNRPAATNRIYVHHHIDVATAEKDTPLNEPTHERIIHPETNLIARERFNIRNRQGYPLKFAKTKPGMQKGKERQGLKMNDIGTVRNQPKMPLKKPEVAPMRYKISVNGLDIMMYRHSVAKLDSMDAIVNPVNTDIITGGQVAQAVYEAAGKLVVDEVNVHRNIFGDLTVSDNVVTSAGKIQALGIVHVAAPIWTDYGQASMEDCARDLHTAIYRTLKTAEAQKYRKVSLPIIGSERCFGLPHDLVAEVYVKALVDYSMGMGPLYPVLEIHLVDLDTQMLLKVKDAYEKWASNPGVMEMAQNLGTVNDPMFLSELKQSAVALEDQPSHTSENMVTFIEQTYNDDGNQRWVFNILGRLKIHVYTGSLIHLDGVEAVACAVDENIRGTLAKTISQQAGVAYDKSLSQARGDQDNLEEGDIVVTNAGQLSMALVMHAVISQPVHTASFTNLDRLENVNTNVLDTATNLGLVSLAIPLLGTGRLREKFEIEQCSLQLVDLLIELVLSQGPELSIRELHLVNENHVVTQSITQALRTRAHAQLRLEVEPRMNTRQDVLSVTNVKSRSKDINATVDEEPVDTTKEMESTSQVQSIVVDRPIDKLRKNPVGVFVKHGKRKKIKERVEVDVTTKENVASKLRINMGQNKKKSKKDSSTESASDTRRNVSDVKYLSEKNLKAHNKQSAWVDSTKINYNDTPRRHNQLEPLPKETQAKPNIVMIQRRPSKPRHPLNTKYVMQRSRAESYKEIFSKRQRWDKDVITNTGNGSQTKLRRTKSTEGKLQNTDNDIFEGFERERLKLERLREVQPKEENSKVQYVLKSNPERKSDKLGNNDMLYRPEIHSSPERLRVHAHRGSVTSREMDLPQNNNLNRQWVKGSGYNRETEDIYMKDVDSHVMQKFELATMEEAIDPFEQNNSTPLTDDITRDVNGRLPVTIPETPPQVQAELISVMQRTPLSTDSPQIGKEENITPPETSPHAIESINSEPESAQSKSEGNNAHDRDILRNHSGQSFSQGHIIKGPAILGNRNMKGPRRTAKTSAKTVIRKKKIENKKVEPFVKVSPKRVMAPTANDVTIRDKLKLEINVVNAKELEDPNVQKEKQKIKRFWEVVGTEPNDESNAQGLNAEEKEKVIVAKVTKERKMSAKSKKSKASGKSMTHNRGDFNVTVEVN